MRMYVRFVALLMKTTVYFLDVPDTRGTENTRRACLEFRMELLYV